ncbi:hypothetical protein Rcae01_01268 [Novipirellula caenicola]|uniref:Uncharacterized protein n=1 Tax=Novipirellula caenicola TaxID=1536901 RepID=A0ABP9VNG2_9BACT
MRLDTDRRSLNMQAYNARRLSVFRPLVDQNFPSRSGLELENIFLFVFAILPQGSVRIGGKLDLNDTPQFRRIAICVPSGFAPVGPREAHEIGLIIAISGGSPSSSKKQKAYL